MRYLLFLAVLATVTGCGPRLEAGGERGGIVSAGSDRTAFEIADRHCQSSGRHARITQFVQAGSRYMFDCVQ